MEYVYAALLLHKLDKDVNEENIGKVVAATGVDVDETKVKSLVASLSGVDIEKELENASLVTAAASATGGESGSAKEEKKAEEKPKEEKKEAAAEGLGALFG